jgi:tetratricopeptide (TPR) repeat protein
MTGLGRRRLILIALLIAGCTPIAQERLTELQQDAMLLYDKGNYTAARESFQTAFALQPTKTVLLYNIGQCSERLGDLEEAEKSYRECLTRLPNHVPSRHALLALLVRRGQVEETRRLVKMWLAQEPNSAAARSAEGWLLHQDGDVVRARARLQEALQINPRDQMALTELGVIYEKMGRPDRAVALYERALEQDAGQLEIARRVKYLKSQGVRGPRPD